MVISIRNAVKIGLPGGNIHKMTYVQLQIRVYLMYQQRQIKNVLRPVIKGTDKL